jgi:hypothetical protein
MRELLEILVTAGTTPAPMINALRSDLTGREEEWNATVFAGRQQATAGVAAACRERQRYVRRFDPVRMAVEHETLLQEKLHGGQLSDGKDVSVDVTILDPFLIPDRPDRGTNRTAAGASTTAAGPARDRGDAAYSRRAGMRVHIRVHADVVVPNS